MRGWMRSLKFKIAMVLLCVAFLTGGISALVYYLQSVQSIRQNTLRTAESTLMQMDRNVARSVEDMRNLVRPVYNQEDIQNLLKGVDTVSASANARKYLGTLIDANHLIYDISIVDTEWKKVSGVNAIVGQQALFRQLGNQYETSTDKKGWFGPFTIIGEDFADVRNCYFLCSVVRNSLSYDKQLGYMCLCIDEGALRNSYRFLAEGSDSMGIINGAGVILSSSQGAELGLTAQHLMAQYDEDYRPEASSIWSDSGRLILTYPSQEGIDAFCYYSIQNLDNFHQQRTIFSRNIFLTGILSLLMAALTGAALIASILRPLDRLKAGMHTAIGGDFQNPVQVVDQGEIGNLARVYNQLIFRIDALLEEVRALEQEKMESQLYVLQTQINPHFVFNTLVTIRLLAEKFGETELADLISNFSQVLRSSIALGRQYVTVAEEVACLESFAAIQQLRYDHHFSLQLDIEEDVRAVMVLKFILQIPVENAISHGFGERGGRGILWIRCKRTEDGLWFAIEDDGVGFSPEKLEEVRALLAKSEFKGFQHSIGLLNLQKRLQMYYGEQYGLAIENLNPGVRVSFTLPVEGGNRP